MTDRELDDLVWLRVLGNDPRGTVVARGRRCHAAPARMGGAVVYTEVYHPSYSADIEAVFRDVVPALNAMGFILRLVVDTTCRATVERRVPGPGWSYGTAEDASPARTICLAALHALGEGVA